MKLIGLLLLFPTILFAQNLSDKIKVHDIAVYHPQEKGLKELSVKIEIVGLLKEINAQKNYGKLSELYFNLHWLAPNQTEVEVIGLPEGFLELKEQLKNYALSVVDFIIPPTLEDKLKGYELKLQKQGASEMIIAFDPSGSKTFSEFKLIFDQTGLATSLIGQKVQGTDESLFSYTKPTFAQNKSIMTKMTTKSSDAGMTILTQITSDYNSVDGYGVPVKIVNSAKITLNSSPKGQGKETETIFLLSDYKINTGSAKKIINK